MKIYGLADEYEKKFHSVLSKLKNTEENVNNFVTYLESKVVTLSDAKEIKTVRNIIERIKRTKKVKNSDISLVTEKDISTVNRWFETVVNKNPSNPDIPVLPTLAKAFGVRIDYLLGVGAFSENELEEKYPTLAKYGIDINVFRNAYQIHCTDGRNLDTVLDTLELLLSEKTSPFSILTSLGQYLNFEEDSYIVYKKNTYADFKSGLEQMADGSENTIDYVNNFLNKHENMPSEVITTMLLDNLENAIKNYKLEVRTKRVKNMFSKLF